MSSTPPRPAPPHAARTSDPGRRPDVAAAQAGTDAPAAPSLPVLLAALLGAPAAWTVQLLGAYTVVSLSCSTGWGGARTVVGVLTVVTIAAAIGSGFLARRVWVRARAVDRPTDDSWDARMGERTARVSFLMVTGLVMAVLFLIGILYQAVPIFLVPVCTPAAGR